jgi:hypothetical protein
LVKSLCLANNVVVVDVPSAFSAELPAGLVLKLSANPAQAAVELIAAWKRADAISDATRARWRAVFVQEHRGVTARLLAAVAPG